VASAHEVDAALGQCRVDAQILPRNFPVAGAFRFGADAERRHQVVEEAVEVVRGEEDYEVCPPAPQLVKLLAKRCVEAALGVAFPRLELRNEHQGTVRHANHPDRHWTRSSAQKKIARFLPSTVAWSR